MTTSEFGPFGRGSTWDSDVELGSTSSYDLDRGRNLRKLQIRENYLLMTRVRGRIRHVTKVLKCWNRKLSKCSKSGHLNLSVLHELHLFDESNINFIFTVFKGRKRLIFSRLVRFVFKTCPLRFRNHMSGNIFCARFQDCRNPANLCITIVCESSNTRKLFARDASSWANTRARANESQ